MCLIVCLFQSLREHFFLLLWALIFISSRRRTRSFAHTTRAPAPHLSFPPFPLSIGVPPSSPEGHPSSPLSISPFRPCLADAQAPPLTSTLPDASGPAFATPPIIRNSGLNWLWNTAGFQDPPPDSAVFKLTTLILPRASVCLSQECWPASAGSACTCCVQVPTSTCPSSPVTKL